MIIEVFFDGISEQEMNAVRGGAASASCVCNTAASYDCGCFDRCVCNGTGSNLICSCNGQDSSLHPLT